MAEEAKHYLYGKQIVKLLNYLLTGLLYNKPDDYLLYLKVVLNGIESNRVDELLYDGILILSAIPKLNLTSVAKEFTYVADDAVEESYFNKIKKLNNKYLSSTEQEDFGSWNSKSINPVLILILGLPHADHLAYVEELMCSSNRFQYFNLNVLLKNCDQMKKIFGGKSELMTSENLRKYLEEQTENILHIMEHLSKTLSQNRRDEVDFIFIDGFPLDKKMLKAFEKKVGEIDAVLLVAVREGVHVGMIDDCNQESGDDGEGHKNSDDLERKINQFKTYVVPLIDYLDNAGKLILPVDVKVRESSWQDVRHKIFECSLQPKKS